MVSKIIFKDYENTKKIIGKLNEYHVKNPNTYFFISSSNNLYELINDKSSIYHVNNKEVNHVEDLRKIVEISILKENYDMSDKSLSFDDYFEENIELTIDVDGAIRVSIQPDWKRNFQKQQRIRLAIYKKLLLHMYTEDRATEETNNVFDIAQRQEEYDA